MYTKVQYRKSFTDFIHQSPNIWSRHNSAVSEGVLLDYLVQSQRLPSVTTVQIALSDLVKSGHIVRVDGKNDAYDAREFRAGLQSNLDKALADAEKAPLTREELDHFASLSFGDLQKLYWGDDRKATDFFSARYRKASREHGFRIPERPATELDDDAEDDDAIQLTAEAYNAMPAAELKLPDAESAVPVGDAKTYEGRKNLMDAIKKNTPIHVVAITSDGRRHYLIAPDTRRNERGELILWPKWSDNASDSKSMSYEFASMFRDRFRNEGNRVKVHFTLQAGSTDFVDEKNTNSQTEDHTKRVPMSYRGLMAVPGFDARSQTPCWYVRFPTTAIESVRGETPEQAIDRTFERNLQDHAEKAPAQPAPEPPKAAVAPGPRRRPGSIQS